MKPILAPVHRLSVTAGLVVALFSACSSDKPDAMIASAKQFIEKNDDKAAVIELKNALQKAPENAEARYFLGIAQSMSGDPLSAEKELRKAKDLNYAPELVVPRLAKAMLDIGESRKVVDEFAATRLADSGAAADLAATLGNAHLSLRQEEKAQQAFSSALAAKPGHAQAKLGEARLKAMSQDLPGAIAMVDEVLAHSPALPEALLFKAELLVAAKDRESAAKVYDQILAATPDNIPAHYKRVMLSMLSQQTDTAAAQLAEMKKVAPKNLQTQYLQALLALKRNELPAAREAAQQVLKSAPNFLPGQFLAGEVEYRLKSYPQAQAHLQKVLEGAPGHAAARRLLSAAYLRDGQPSRALETLAPLLGKNSEDSGLLMLAGEVYMNNNQLAEAESYFSKASKLDKDNVAARTRLGQLKFASGDAPAGMHELEAAVDIDSASYQADVLLIAAHLRRNEADKALAAVAKLEKKQAANPLTHHLRAAALLLKGDAAASRKSLERALELDPVYFPSALTLALLDVQDKKWDAAKQRFEKMLEKDPKNPQALLALAQLRLDTGAPAKDVLELIDRAVAGNPTNAQARIALIRYRLKSDPKRAAASAQEALAAIPDHPEILDALGVAQQAAGETNQALATFSKLAALRPKSPEPLLRQATLEMFEKRSEAAVKTLKKALALKPDLIEAQLGLAAIHAREGRFADALQVAREIQKQRPKAAVGYLTEGDVFAGQKKWPEAATAYRSGLDKAHTSDLAAKLYAALIAGERAADAEKFGIEWNRDHPKDIIVRALMADRSMAVKKYQEAASQYKALLAIDPKNALFLNNLAWVSGELKDPKAVDYAEQALSLQPKNAAILDTLGTLLVAKGEAARGTEFLREASALAPKAWGIRINLAKALAQSGQKDAARKELEPLLKLEENPSARAAATELIKTL